ncbi:hypothetical protein QNI19_36085 [Cytophagaceae bacterium DM2B3-1]|uniref:Toll/interleukin-1 receptor domain-containing protein n=1 Tax=Xanthocytophaga flava TaxID=3048013 RepID=A0ABT7CY36_9BACT|nr:hypothetical protein [Xanthocytophaga flavus]MDJ1498411.1 hypothetical protein [Xanthocytophaga flavus]
MYRGFNLEIDFTSTLKENSSYKDIGKSQLQKQKTTVESKLQKFLFDNDTLNGEEIQKNWFPEIEAHIFLSHSHKDLDNALLLAGWLYEKYELVTFIDSLVWGYSDKLLKIIDDKYCLNPSGKTYSYEKRNLSSAHVHLMLSAALNTMIDKCECIFFLNTLQSISSKIDDNYYSSSPWIYMELVTTRTIQKTIPKRIRQKHLNEGIEEDPLKILYKLSLSHLQDLDYNILKGLSKGFGPESVLDSLYKDIPLKG